MKFLARLAVLFYVTAILFAGSFMLVFAMHGIPRLYEIPFRDFYVLLTAFYFDIQMRWFIGILAVIMLIKNYIYMQALIGHQQKGEAIAFDNPSGRVTVSLTAIEDLVRRSISNVPEIKEVRSSIVPGKKALEIDSRIVLNKDVHIPEMTARLQELVRRKIHETIGLEDTIVVRVHVVKIAPEDHKGKRQKGSAENQESIEPTVPFPGYRV